MTSKHMTFREIIPAKKSRGPAVDADTAWHWKNKVETFDLEIPGTPAPVPVRGRDWTFYDNPDPIIKETLKVRVTGASKGKKVYDVDLVQLDATLTTRDARELCTLIVALLEPLVAPRRVPTIPIKLLDCEIVATSRSKK